MYITKNRGLNEVLVQKLSVSIKKSPCQPPLFFWNPRVFTLIMQAQSWKDMRLLCFPVFFSCFRVKVSTYMMKWHKCETGFYVDLKFGLKKDSFSFIQRTNNGGFVGWKKFFLRPLPFKRFGSREAARGHEPWLPNGERRPQQIICTFINKKDYSTFMN